MIMGIETTLSVITTRYEIITLHAIIPYEINLYTATPFTDTVCGTIAREVILKTMLRPPVTPMLDPKYTHETTVATTTILMSTSQFSTILHVRAITRRLVVIITQRRIPQREGLLFMTLYGTTDRLADAAAVTDPALAASMKLKLTCSREKSRCEPEFEIGPNTQLIVPDDVELEISDGKGGWLPYHESLLRRPPREEVYVISGGSNFIVEDEMGNILHRSQPRTYSTAPVSVAGSVAGRSTRSRRDDGNVSSLKETRPMQSTSIQQQPGSSRRPPGFLPLPRLESNGWSTPAVLSRATSPWEHGTPNAYSDTRQSHPAPPTLQPLRLSLLQRRADSSASTTTNLPDSPRPLSPLSPLSPVRFNRPDGSALGIIVPPGTPPADALPRWLLDRRFSKRKSASPEARSSSKGPAPRSAFDYPSFALVSPGAYDLRDEPQSFVQTPGPIEGQGNFPHVVSVDSFPFDLEAVTGERIRTPAEPRIRPRPLPRCSSDDMTDGRLFRVNAWGEHESPSDATTGLFSLMQGQPERRSRARQLPPSRLASRAPSPKPSPE
ncbi:hypothetical protein FRC07_003997 [Ceratobasidium sp. 392]|nr:hypothetical protein FRC07_003997 [Ceratobasidium sp. 392]